MKFEFFITWSMSCLLVGSSAVLFSGESLDREIKFDHAGIVIEPLKIMISRFKGVELEERCKRALYVVEHMQKMLIDTCRVAPDCAQLILAYAAGSWGNARRDNGRYEIIPSLLKKNVFAKRAAEDSNTLIFDRTDVGTLLLLCVGVIARPLQHFSEYPVGKMIQDAIGWRRHHLESDFFLCYPISLPSSSDELINFNRFLKLEPRIVKKDSATALVGCSLDEDEILMYKNLGSNELATLLHKAYTEMRGHVNKNKRDAIAQTFLRLYNKSALPTLLEKVSQLPDSTVVLIDPKLLE